MVSVGVGRVAHSHSRLPGPRGPTRSDNACQSSDGVPTTVHGGVASFDRWTSTPVRVGLRVHDQVAHAGLIAHLAAFRDAGVVRGEPVRPGVAALPGAGDLGELAVGIILGRRSGEARRFGRPPPRGWRSWWGYRGHQRRRRGGWRRARRRRRLRPTRTRAQDQHQNRTAHPGGLQGRPHRARSRIISLRPSYIRSAPASSAPRR